MDSHSLPIDPEELLDETARLRRLARAILGDDGRAEDAVQEGLLAAWRGGLLAESWPAAWLRAVVRNRALQIRRGEQRRHRRERAVAAAEDQASAASSRTAGATHALERSEAVLALASAVQRLPEAYRTVVVLRHYDGCTVAQVAKRLELPAATVRTRLRRALRMLRAELGAALGKECWESRLFALALPGLAGSSALLIGGWMMGTTVKVALAAAGVAAAFLLLAPEETSGPDPNSAVEIELAAAAASDGLPAAGTEAAAPATTGPEVRVGATEAAGPEADATAGRCRVEVLVVDPEGSPRPGIELTLLWRPLEEVRGQFETGRTGADGRWLVELATPVRFLSVYTDPTAEQPSAYHREDRRLESGDSQEVRLELPAAGILSGVVLDAAGAPVPGAEVLGWHTRGEDVWPQVEPHLRVLTDEHGRFRVEDLAGWILLVAQKGQQMATHGLRGALASGATVRDIMLRIDERHELTGTVLTETGEAVAGARVRLESHLPRGNLPPLERASGLGYQGPSAQVTADDGGRFSWSVPVGQAGGVWASAAGFAPAGVPLRPGQERVEVRLGSLSRFTVRVVDHRGEPVAGALVLACRENVFASDPTDVDGWIELRFPKPGPAALLARADGHALTAAGPFDLQPGMAPIELRLGISHNLEGVVVDASGAPIRGAKVRIAGDRLLEGSGRLLDARPTWEALHGLHETVTDAAGGFRFPDLYAGEFRIEVTPEGAALDPAVAYAVAGDDPLRIVLGQGREHMAVLRGRVYDLETGDGVGPCAIQLRHRFERIRSHDRRAVDRPDGRFSFAVLDPSTLAEIMVDAEGYVPAFLHLEGTGTGETDLEIGLRPAATVEIEILDEDGAVLPNAGVWVKDERGESIPLDLIGNTDLICHSLDRSGVIRLPRLPRGTVVIHVGSGQLEGSAKVDTAHLPPGPVRIVLRPRKR